jgi:hypothetical protein
VAGHSKWSEIKRQKGRTETRDQARRAGLQRIARGERPIYRPQVEPDGDLFFIGIPELDIATQARHRGEVPSRARECIATWLGVDGESFDIELRDRGDAT